MNHFRKKCCHNATGFNHTGLKYQAKIKIHFHILHHNKFIESLNNLAKVLLLHFSNCTQFKRNDLVGSEHSLPMIALPIYLPSASVDSSIETHIGPS